jgi:hypothetical protein
MSDSTIPALTSAAALTGVEPFPSVQSSADVKVTAKQVADYVSSGTVAIRLTSVNFNSANTDNPIAIPLPTGVTRYQVAGLFLNKASASISTATAGLFTAAAAGGVAIVTGGSAITVTATAADTNNNSQSMTVNNAGTEAYTETTLYFRVGTAQGSAATADVIIHIRPLS